MTRPPKTFRDRLHEHVRLVVLRCLTEIPADDAQRLAVLRTLAGAPGYVASLSVLQGELVHLGHSVTRDRMAVLGGWLAEQGLCVAAGSAAVPGLRLTQRGLEAAGGMAAVPGVAGLPTVTWLLERMAGACLEVSADDVEAAVGWLSAAGLVTVADGAVWPTARAAAVASGRVVMEGIQAPSAGSVLAAAAGIAKATLGGL